jgi:hypothetical protein
MKNECSGMFQFPQDPEIRIQVLDLVFINDDLVKLVFKTKHP